MTDLISREAAKTAIRSKFPNLSDRCEINTVLNELPAVDAVPVVHGRWTTHRTWKHDGEWYCTVCEYEPVVFMDSSYCPNCGAKMDSERRDEDG